MSSTYAGGLCGLRQALGPLSLSWYGITYIWYYQPLSGLLWWGGIGQVVGRQHTCSVHVCMYVYIYICIKKCRLYAYVYIYIYMHAHTYAHTYAYACCPTSLVNSAALCNVMKPSISPSESESSCKYPLKRKPRCANGSSTPYIPLDPQPQTKSKPLKTTYKLSGACAWKGTSSQRTWCK